MAKFRNDLNQLSQNQIKKPFSIRKMALNNLFTSPLNSSDSEYFDNFLALL